MWIGEKMKTITVLENVDELLEVLQNGEEEVLVIRDFVHANLEIYNDDTEVSVSLEDFVRKLCKLCNIEVAIYWKRDKEIY